MKYLILDIETIGDPEQIELETSLLKPAANIKDPAKKELNLRGKINNLERKAALLDSAIISCIGVKTPDYICNFSNLEIDPTEREAMLSAGIFCDSSENEKEMLMKFGKFLNEIVDDETPVITFNGYGFDLPKLRFRNAWHGMSLPQALKRTQRAEDMMNTYSRYFSMNKSPFVSMSEVAQRLGILPQGKTMSGGDYGEIIKNKDYTKAVLYNVLDCMVLEQIYYRLCL